MEKIPPIEPKPRDSAEIDEKIRRVVENAFRRGFDAGYKLGLDNATKQILGESKEAPVGFFKGFKS